MQSIQSAVASVAQDVRYAVRASGRAPGFVTAAVLSLAVGIGANTAVFSLINSLLIRPLPYKDSERIVILWNRSPGLQITQDWFSTAQYFDIKTGHRGFEQVAIAIGGNVNLTGGGEPERIGAIRVSSGLLPILGVAAERGRLFAPDEDSPGRNNTALLSHALWTRRYGADPQVLGRSIVLNGLSYEVIGILPRSFSLPREVLPTLGGAEEGEVILPLPLPMNAPQIRTREDYNIIGKLRPGITTRKAQAEMDVITARLCRNFPELYPPNGGLTFSIVPLIDQVVGDVRKPLYILLGAVACVLLIACANVANLMLARAMGRGKEIAVRAAIGAGRARIVRQLLTESVLLSLCAGGLGVLLALWGLDWACSLGSRSIPRLGEITFDGRVLGFTLAVSLLTGVLFGLVPALRLSRIDLNATLKDSGRSPAGVHSMWGRGHNVRRFLVVSELAVSVLLLIGAGLLIRSFVRLQHVDPGFNSRNLTTLGLTLTGNRYADATAVLPAYHRLWTRLEGLPGVVAVGGSSALPLTQTFAWTPITIEGRTPMSGEKFINADERIVARNYFQAMEIPLRMGRYFDERDTADVNRVTIIDESMARQFWPGESPIGKRIHQVQSRIPWLTIVGVVGQVKHDTLHDPNPRIVFYLPHTQYPTRSLSIVLRTGTDPSSLAPAVRNEIHDLDPDLPVYQVSPMSSFVDQSLAQRRFSTLTLSIFAGIALALATLGIYGLMAYMVNQGIQEIGIRIAMGATESGIWRMIVSQSMALAAMGIAIGVLAAFGLTRFLSSLLYGVTATDTLTFAGIPGLLILISLAAACIPARRAARVNPLAALRCE